MYQKAIEPSADDVAPRPFSGWSTELMVVKGGVVVPPTSPGFITKSGLLRANGDECKRAALWRNKRPLTIKPDAPTGPVEKLAGKWLWGGVLCGHFGHFLVESTGRLWGLDYADDDIEGVIFIPKRPAFGDNIKNFQRSFLEQSGSKKPLKLITSPTEVEHLLVPGQGFGLGRIINGTPAARKAFSRFGSSVPAKGSKKIYISRSRLGVQKGALVGETQLEAYLETEGYEIFHPQAHDIEGQIAQYKAATHVIAAEGSAIHMFAMVGRPHQKLSIILRRRSEATQMIQQHLKSFSGIKAVTLDALAGEWRPKEQARKRQWLGQLHLPALQRMLATSGFIESGGAPWQQMSDQELNEVVGDKFVKVTSQPKPTKRRELIKAE